MTFINIIVIPQELVRNYRFESNMALEQHRHFNKMLNEMVTKTRAKDYKVKALLINSTLQKLKLTYRVNVFNINIPTKLIDSTLYPIHIQSGE